MAPEIADSDGESDLVENHNTEVRPEEPPIPPKDGLAPAGHVLPPQVNFDDFLDPTQALSDQSPIQNDVPGPGTGSTEKMLQGLASAQKNLGGSSLEKHTGNIDKVGIISGKRRHSASEDGPSSLQDVPGRKKRVKTDGSKSTSGSIIDLCADLDDDAPPQMPSPHMINSSGPQDVEQDVTVNETRLQHDGEMPTARERDRPRRVISLIGQPVNASGHHLSTTMSSYGGYESYELNFRGAADSLNISVNPFADLSQASLDGGREDGLQPELQKEMMTSLDWPQDIPVPDSINPAMLVQVDPPEAIPSTECMSKRCKTENAGCGSTASPAPSSRRAASVSAESVSNISDRAQPRKRGRRAKSSKLANSSQQEPMAPPDVPEQSPSRRCRRGTLDSSQVPHDETPSNTKGKGKQSKPESMQVEEPPSKNSSSDLRFDDEAIIGLPKENYNPRPSRRRSRQAIEDEESNQQEQMESLPQMPEATEAKTGYGSPAKQLASDLNLSDEQLIGLPKENYKPRPSRRRSRPVIDGEQLEPDWTGLLPEIPEVPTLTKKFNGKVDLEKTPPNEPRAEPEPTPQTLAKKSKKAKVKRAKTSAAALLKKSSQMLSDGEDDVLWVDQKPAAVKLDLPRDLKALKKEEETKPDVESTAPPPKRAKSKISIEIPSSIGQDKQGKTTQLEPEAPPGSNVGEERGEGKRKRGRPKKSPLPTLDPTLEKAPTPEPLTDAEGAPPPDPVNGSENEENDDDIRPPGPSETRQARPPLAQKDANALPTPPHPPPKPPTDTSSTDKENATPATHKANASTTPSPSKGPTFHSPIQPASGWNSKSRYRVGLSKRQSIPSLLRKVDKTKAAPTKVGVKVKERKVKDTNEDGDGEDGGGGGGGNPTVLRDRDGNLVEWEF